MCLNHRRRHSLIHLEPTYLPLSSCPCNRVLFTSSLVSYQKRVRDTFGQIFLVQEPLKDWRFSPPGWSSVGSLTSPGCSSSWRWPGRTSCSSPRGRVGAPPCCRRGPSQTGDPSCNWPAGPRRAAIAACCLKVDYSICHKNVLDFSNLKIVFLDKFSVPFLNLNIAFVVMIR